MKRILCFLFVFLMSVTLPGCDDSYEISGIDRFDENLCSMGTCDDLLPENTRFLSDHPYEDGDFYYWTDGDYSKAKTFVRLRYSQDIYPDAKSICENFYRASQLEFEYEGFTLWVTNVSSDMVDDSIMKMFGYNDDNSTLIFIGFADYTSDPYGVVAESGFQDLLRDEFGAYF